MYWSDCHFKPFNLYHFLLLMMMSLELTRIIFQTVSSLFKCYWIFISYSDCIGSAFNAKGAMQCPNCRKVEKGRWLYANGNRSSADFDIDGWVTEDIYDLGYSELVCFIFTNNLLGKVDHNSFLDYFMTWRKINSVLMNWCWNFGYLYESLNWRITLQLLHTWPDGNDMFKLHINVASQKFFYVHLFIWFAYPCFYVVEKLIDKLLKWSFFIKIAPLYPGKIIFSFVEIIFSCCNLLCFNFFS